MHRCGTRTEKVSLLVVVVVVVGDGKLFFEQILLLAPILPSAFLAPILLRAAPTPARQRHKNTHYKKDMGINEKKRRRLAA
jgi:hypothetical protein